MFKCPKCRGGDFDVCEAVVVDDWIEIRGGKVVERGRGDGARTVGFTAACKCGHRWNMRRSTGNAVVEEASELENEFCY